MYSRSGVGLTMSCRSDSGLFAPLPAGMCTGWTRKRGLTGESFSHGGGWTNVGMGLGGLRYRMFVEGFSGGLDVAGELFLLFLFLGGGEANISGSAGFSSVSGGLSLSGEVGVSNICLDSVSKQILASKYGWGGLMKSSDGKSGVLEGEGRGGVFKFSSTVSNSGSTVGDSG